METTNLDKSLTDILMSNYVVPLYQRNFAWGEEELSRLLQDIYESFLKNPSGNYYIGSLVVLKRKNGYYEVIDGQQRLTAITLIWRLLDDTVREPKLFYDSRPEVEAFFSSFYRTGKTNDVTFDYKVSHLVNAIDIINESKLEPYEENSPTIKTNNIDLQSFKNYFAEKVILVRVEIPHDTDVATYFEIMNNRGEQLQKHEILKAKLIDKIKNEDGNHDQRLQAIFSRIWDACSQMDIYIQKSFSQISIKNAANEITYKGDRETLFGANYDGINLEEIANMEVYNDVEAERNVFISDIILNHRIYKTDNKSTSSQTNESIIDFPNFLMHIFRLLYNSKYQNITKSDKNENGLTIPLNEKDLLMVFDKIEASMDSMEFISKLLYYRTVFDRYIIKSSQSENSEDGFRWSLDMPTKYESLDFKNTFKDNERIPKCLSMLQVTYRTKKYKNWLLEVLGWFCDETDFYISSEIYQKKLDGLVCKYYTDNIEYKEITKEHCYSKGTDTPHFLFNFIDYLYWVESQKDEKKQKINFDFKYRNSVEHHLPQSFENEENMIQMNNLGNLCLVSKSSNSRMNNEAPTGKADKNGKYYKSNLPPKQRIMYDITNEKNKWGNDEIANHYNEVVELLGRRTEILSF